jgi:two-component sensor histidine kinase
MCHNNLGSVYKNQGLFAESIYEAEMAIDLFKKANNDSLIGHSEYSLGLSLKKNGLNNRAIQHISKSVEIFEELGLSEFVARAYQPLANISKDLGDIDQALFYHDQSRQIYLDIGDTASLGTVFHNMAQIYIIQDSSVKALSYLAKEREIKKSFNKSLHSNSTLFGEAFLEQGAYDSAHFYFINALNGRLEENRIIELASSYFHLGNYYFHVNQLDSAKVYLRKGYQIGRELSQSQILIDIIALQLRIDKIEYGSLPLIDRYEELINLKDSVLGEKSLQAFKRFEVEYSLLEKDKEIELSKATIKIKSVENENLNFKYKTALLVILAILILVIIIFFLSLRMQKKNRLLKEKNDVIENLHQELAHRTKNYYQMFGGMLRYDLDDAQNQEAKDLLNRYISRVEAMSQIQHYLIDEQNGVKEKIELNIYLSELIDQIELALNHKFPKVKIEKKLNPVIVNYDQALRLGIALNELLQNAFKHSFDNIEEPKMSINLTDLSEEIILEIKDNGIGFSNKKIDQRSSNGIRLISLLLKNTKTKMDYNLGVDSGVQITIKLAK